MASNSLASKRYRSKHQNHHPKCLSSKVKVKDVFLHNGGQRNAFAYVSRSNCSRCFFNLLKDPNPSYPVLRFGDNLSSRNRDMAQNVISKCCNLEWSRSSVKVKTDSIRPRHPPISARVKFHQNLICLFFCYGVPIQVLSQYIEPL